jgi:hypothetical protein
MRQAVSVNKSAHDVILLGDTEHGDGVSTVPLEELRSVWGDQFIKLYEHMSTNSERFELFCWLRWFYLLQYMQLEHVTCVLHLDTDVLLYSSIQELHRVYGGMTTDCGLMIPEQDFSSFMWCVSGHMSYWTRAFLENFCDFILRTFKDEGLKQYYRKKWAWHQATNSPGGICDMTTLFLFWRENQQMITNLAMEVQGTVFDVNMSLSSNYQQDEYVMEGNCKKIRFVKKSKPVFFRIASPSIPVSVHAIHFQGQAKKYIPKYLSGRKSLSMYRRELLNSYRTLRKRAHLLRLFGIQ